MAPLGESKPKVLEKYGAYVRSLAGQVRKQFNAQFELEELVSWGQIGLLEAADRFDPRVGTNFLTFAHYRIKGSIYDGLRKMGVLKGSTSGERANAYLGNLAERDVGGGAFDDDVRELSSAVTGMALSYATSLDSTDGLQLSDGALRADDMIELEQLRDRIRGALQQLPQNEREVLESYYFKSQTLEEAGALIGQSKSWASRLHARAIERLKQLLEEEDDNRSVDRRTTDGRTTRRDSSQGDRPKDHRARGPPGQRSSG